MSYGISSMAIKKLEILKEAQTQIPFILVPISIFSFDINHHWNIDTIIIENKNHIYHMITSFTYPIQIMHQVYKLYCMLLHKNLRILLY